MPTQAPEFTPVQEQTRTYHFPGGEKLRIENVVAFAAPRTTHRLECADGSKWIVPAGWLAIQLEVAEWSR